MRKHLLMRIFRICRNIRAHFSTFPQPQGQPYSQTKKVYKKKNKREIIVDRIWNVIDADFVFDFDFDSLNCNDIPFSNNSLYRTSQWIYWIWQQDVKILDAVCLVNIFQKFDVKSDRANISHCIVQYSISPSWYHPFFPCWVFLLERQKQSIIQNVELSGLSTQMGKVKKIPKFQKLHLFNFQLVLFWQKPDKLTICLGNSVTPIVVTL